MKKNHDSDRQLTERLLALERREGGRKSLLVFARTYLANHFRLPACKFHLELVEILQNISIQRDQRVAVAAPRGYAKSTIVNLAYPLWAICYGREPYVLIISGTHLQAKELLASIKKELEDNPILQNDFPNVCGSVGSSLDPSPWKQNQIVTRNKVMVAAFGVEQNIRGLRHRQHRPSLVILDDVENQETVVSGEQREKLYTWFSKTLLKMGETNTNVIVIGTVMHYKSLLERLINPSTSAGWLGRKYQAVISWPDQLRLWDQWEAIYCGLKLDEQGHDGPKAAARFFKEHKQIMLKGVKVLWPEQESFYELMVLRIREGKPSFDSEKQNEPVDRNECLFGEEDFVFWDADGCSEEDLIRSLGQHIRFIGACDPSLGRAGKGRDDSAIVTLLQDTKQGTCYVLDAHIARDPVDRIIDNILAYYRRRNYRTFAIETNQFQEVMADVLIERAHSQRLYPRIKKITHTSDKIARIQRLQPMVKAGVIRFSKEHRTLLDQLRQFPYATNDDAPDALEMAVNVALPRGRRSIRQGFDPTAYLPQVGSSNLPGTAGIVGYVNGRRRVIPFRDLWSGF